MFLEKFTLFSQYKKTSRRNNFKILENFVKIKQPTRVSLFIQFSVFLRVFRTFLLKIYREVLKWVEKIKNAEAHLDEVETPKSSLLVSFKANLARHECQANSQEKWKPPAACLVFFVNYLCEFCVRHIYSIKHLLIIYKSFAKSKILCGFFLFLAVKQKLI